MEGSIIMVLILLVDSTHSSMYVCMYDPPARTRRLTLTCLKKKQQPPTASPLLSLSHLPHAMQLTTQPPHHHHYNQDHYHIIKSSITESDTSCQYTYVGDSVVSPFLIFFYNFFRYSKKKKFLRFSLFLKTFSSFLISLL